MKVCIFQPPYSTDVSCSDELFAYKCDLLDRCDDSLDLIVLPEYSDVPCGTSTREETLFYHDRYFDKLMEKCVETAKRCNSMVFVNALCAVNGNYRNTTYAIDRNGNVIGQYYKKHLPPLEQEVLQLDSGYTFAPSDPYIVEAEGLRFAFLTCYDLYFYEAFARIAQEDVDVIICCSLQRSDSHTATEIMCRFLAYNTNAYVLRSSVSFREDSAICGASMAVAPDGEVLLNMKGRFGMETAEFDPHKKFLKPAGYGNGDAPHYKYIEYGRKPWQYRQAGSGIVPPDDRMPYPRLCAHRGFSTVAPENSMPAFGAAVALGAQEIEFDLWKTKDDEWVSIHDCRLERVSNGTGYVFDYTLAELRQMDFGSKYSERFAGLGIVTLEEILQKFACRTVMNIHLKSMEEEFGTNEQLYSDDMLKKLIRTLDRYDCRGHVYFMTVSEELHRRLAALAPDISRCMGENFDDSTDIVERALKCGCEKVQLFEGRFDRALIDKALSHGLICNVFWADDPEKAKALLGMGVHTVLTNDYLTVSRGVGQ